MNNKKYIYTVASTVLFLDQIIKLLVIHFISMQKKVTIIPNFFSLYFIKNTGAAFSILENNTLLLIILSVIFIIIINNYIKKEPVLDKNNQIAFGLILGGIFGNLIDRIIHKAVIDYLLFYIKSHAFPVFNLADVAICLGVFILSINYLKESRNNK